MFVLGTAKPIKRRRRGFVRVRLHWLSKLLDRQHQRPKEAAEQYRQQSDPSPSVPCAAELKGLLLGLVRWE